VEQRQKCLPNPASVQYNILMFRRAIHILSVLTLTMFGLLSCNESEQTQTKDDESVKTVSPSDKVKPSDKGPGQVKEQPVIITEIMLTNWLPRFVRYPYIRKLTLKDRQIVRGTEFVEADRRVIYTKNVHSLAKSMDEEIVRIEIEINKVSGVIKKRGSATEIAIVDGQGKRWNSIGCILINANRDQYIHIVRPKRIKRIKDVPFDQMKDAIALYLYFSVPVGTKLTSFVFGSRSHNINLVADANTIPKVDQPAFLYKHFIRLIQINKPKDAVAVGEMLLFIATDDELKRVTNSFLGRDPKILLPSRSDHPGVQAIINQIKRRIGKND